MCRSGEAQTATPQNTGVTGVTHTSREKRAAPLQGWWWEEVLSRMHTLSQRYRGCGRSLHWGPGYCPGRFPQGALGGALRPQGVTLGLGGVCWGIAAWSLQGVRSGRVLWAVP